jgi:hypothetical protein
LAWSLTLTLSLSNATEGLVGATADLLGSALDSVSDSDSVHVHVHGALRTRRLEAF